MRIQSRGAVVLAQVAKGQEAAVEEIGEIEVLSLVRLDARLEYDAQENQRGNDERRPKEQPPAQTPPACHDEPNIERDDQQKLQQQCHGECTR